MEFNADQIYDIIKKLTGKIEPYADSAIDNERLKNIKVFIEVFDKMHRDIDYIAYHYKDYHHASVKEIVAECNKHLDSMGICEGNCKK